MTAHLLRQPRTYRIRADDYLALNERGAFEGLRTELIEGEIIVMNPQTRRHLFVKSELAYRLRRALEATGSTLFVAVDGTVEVSEESLPEPDILLTSAPHGDGYVPIASLKLAVEVAATSLDLDLCRKVALYARHTVPEYWVADVNGRVIHQLWAPAGEAFLQRREVAFGAVMEAVTVAGLRVETGGL